MDAFALSPLQPLNLTGNQKSDEPFEDYFTAIINLDLQCDLEALREELTKAKIISGLDDLRTRLMAEEDKTLTLSYVIKYLKTAESSRQAVTQMQKDNRVDVFPMSEDELLAKSKEHMPSPAQLLYSRNLRARIPVRSEDLKPKVYRLPEKFVRHEDTVKKYYDKRTTSLQPLREGQNIRFQKHQSGHWYAGKVKGKGPQPHSYQVRDHHKKSSDD
ncbi:hypothetical protein ILUMI_16453 [Ignelater luminosus]|uniref:Uncharacterized protein n=1 Tax=Ignelater luminosus TaxID=2038154 RepID=A0A8K0CUE1_IGNLU|nr:hypothetical protein ILUMI_16453 [Ignelater luminosus]